ncbi:MAG: hypothetical protein ONB46_17535 [candidate division KSB1 bacterium]|nr:hypothetical protein [candidate division KSB1 bacterium]
MGTNQESHDRKMHRRKIFGFCQAPKRIFDEKPVHIFLPFIFLSLLLNYFYPHLARLSEKLAALSWLPPKAQSSRPQARLLSAGGMRFPSYVAT